MAAICQGCGANVGCGCNLSPENLCAGCQMRKVQGLPFIRVARFIKNILFHHDKFSDKISV